MGKDLNHEETFTATVRISSGIRGSPTGTPDDPIRCKAVTLFQGLQWQRGINSFH